MEGSLKVLFLIISTWIAYIIFLLMLFQIFIPYQDFFLIFFSICVGLVSLFGTILFEIKLREEK